MAQEQGLPEWHSLTPAEVTDRLDTSPAGLSSAEAGRRLQIYGTNALAETGGETRWRIFIRQFRSVLIAILIVAVIASLLVGEVVDAGAILLIVLLNAILGYTQEWQAEKAIQSLRQLLTLRAMVIRDEIEQEVDATTIVPGDVVVLEMGRKVPADLYLIEGTTLQVDEAPLTGESVPVEKAPGTLSPGTDLSERTNMAFTGTSVTNGRGKGIVVSTGMGTEFGKIAVLSQAAETKQTPLAKRLDMLGRRMGEISLLVAAVVVVLGILQQRGILEMFLTGISLAVAVIPEGLPAVVTLTLALGVQAMRQRNCLIRNLAASETLGSVSIICTDKTGTLTKNEMTVTRICVPAHEFEVTGCGYDLEGEFLLKGRAIDPLSYNGLTGLLRAGVLCSHAIVTPGASGGVISGSPTEGALLVAAHKAGLPSPDAPSSPQVAEFSFNSFRKRMTIVYHEEGLDVAYVKGAPEIILDLCNRYQDDSGIKPLEDSIKKIFQDGYRRFASSGLRTLAMAYRPLPAGTPLEEETVERDLIYLGIAGILDPPRPEAKGALATCKRAGIEVMMITGDAPETAQAIADALGMERTSTLRGSEITAMDDRTLAERLRETRVLARVTAEHKLRIVALLTEQGHTVAMTGDGINDSPALKSAHIGIAMGIKGTDVAKESSDMILVDDNFASIVAGVEEGRREYDNISKFTRYLLSSNMGEIVAIIGALILNLPLILWPIQILWINLITDGVTALSLGVEPAEKDIMIQRPRDPALSILSGRVLLLIALIGLFIGGVMIVLFMSRYAADLDRARTLVFTGIVVFEIYNLLNFRSFRSPLYRVGIMTNRWLIVAVVSTLIIQVLAVYHPVFQILLNTVPLELSDWLLLALLGLPLLVAGELYKTFRYPSLPDVQ
jgi:P-type Ca2+ transporter type 2C